MTSDPEQPEFPLDDDMVEVPSHHDRMEALFRAEHENLVRFLTARTGSADAARELSSEAFTKLLSHKRPVTVKSFPGYLYKTACNLATSEGLRSLKPQHRYLTSGAEPPQGTSPPDPERECMDHEQSALLDRTIGALRPKHRLALISKYWDDLTHNEIVARFRAEGIKINERTVRRWIESGEARCREAIQASKDPKMEGRK